MFNRGKCIFLSGCISTAFLQRCHDWRLMFNDGGNFVMRQSVPSGWKRLLPQHPLKNNIKFHDPRTSPAAALIISDAKL